MTGKFNSVKIAEGRGQTGVKFKIWKRNDAGFVTLSLFRTFKDSKGEWRDVHEFSLGQVEELQGLLGGLIQKMKDNGATKLPPRRPDDDRQASGGGSQGSSKSYPKRTSFEEDSLPESF